jgi:aminopeptidase N
MERASGRDLGWFFRQWLNRGGMPRLEGSWRYDGVARRVEVTVTQSQAGELFRLPLEIGVMAAPQGPYGIERVEVTERRTTFMFAAEREPVGVALDPSAWLLMDSGPFTRARE